jgi:chaperonin cofactor prefoldin
MRGLSKLEGALLIGGFLLEAARTIYEIRKEHDLEEKVDTLEERVQTLEKHAHRHGRPRKGGRK